MERRRNRPVKYNRELVGKTIMAMQRCVPGAVSAASAGVSRCRLLSTAAWCCLRRVEEIRQARQARHWEARMRKAAKVQLKNDKKQLEQEIHLVRAPHVKAEEKEKVRLAGETAVFHGLSPHGWHVMMSSANVTTTVLLPLRSGRGRGGGDVRVDEGSAACVRQFCSSLLADPGVLCTAIERAFNVCNCPSSKRDASDEASASTLTLVCQRERVSAHETPRWLPVSHNQAGPNRIIPLEAGLEAESRGAALPDGGRRRPDVNGGRRDAVLAVRRRACHFCATGQQRGSDLPLAEPPALHGIRCVVFPRRLCVKNIPKHVPEHRIKALFQEHGCVAKRMPPRHGRPQTHATAC